MNKLFHLRHWIVSRMDLKNYGSNTNRWVMYSHVLAIDLRRLSQSPLWWGLDLVSINCSFFTFITNVNSMPYAVRISLWLAAVYTTWEVTYTARVRNHFVINVIFDFGPNRYRYLVTSAHLWQLGKIPLSCRVYVYHSHTETKDCRFVVA